MSQAYEVSGIESTIERLEESRNEASVALRRAWSTAELMMGALKSSPLLGPVLLRTCSALFISFLLVQLAKSLAS